MTKFQITFGLIILVILGDIAIWFGLYFLSSKAHIRKCYKEGIAPNLRFLKVVYVISFLIVHLFLIWLGYEVVKWGGQN